MRPAAAVYTLDTLSPADMAEITGKPTPTFGWDLGAASGATDLVGSDNLVDAGTPTKEVVDSILGGKTSTLDTSTDDSIIATSASVANPGAVTVTGILICRLNAAGEAFPRGLAQKRDGAAGNNGWDVSTRNRQLILILDTPLGLLTRTIAVDHGTTNAQVLLFTRSVANNAGSIFSREGSSQGSCNNDTLSSAAKLAVGAGASRSQATGAQQAKLFLWHGTDGDGFAESERLAVAQALGYEA